MKRVIVFVLLCTLAAWTVNAQPGKKPPKPPTPQELQKEMEKNQKKVEQDMKNHANPNSQKDPPGNAYGKDKQGLDGRDFGQQRAADAQSKKSAQDAINKNITDAAALHQQTLQKIEAGLTTLEAKHKAKQIAEADYQAKKKAFEDLKARVEELDRRNNELKGKMTP